MSDQCTIFNDDHTKLKYQLIWGQTTNIKFLNFLLVGKYNKDIDTIAYKQKEVFFCALIMIATKITATYKHFQMCFFPESKDSYCFPCLGRYI